MFVKRELKIGLNWARMRFALSGQVNVSKPWTWIWRYNSLRSSGFTQDFGNWLLPNSHNSVSEWSTLSLGDTVWLAVELPVHPKGAGRGWCQRSVQASQILSHQTGKTISIRERVKHKGSSQAGQMSFCVFGNLTLFLTRQMNQGERVCVCFILSLNLTHQTLTKFNITD